MHFWLWLLVYSMPPGTIHNQETLQWIFGILMVVEAIVDLIKVIFDD